MNKDKISKYLSYILRHSPESINIKLDSNGWASIEEIIKNTDSFKLNYEIIKEVVDTNTKKRFAISEDSKMIRANQGHSINVDLNLEEKIPPEFLYHGTASRFIDSIKESGIKSMDRQHVHLSLDKETAEIVGKRHGKPVILIIKALEMYKAGFKFYLSENGVWLSEEVKAEYILF